MSTLEQEVFEVLMLTVTVDRAGNTIYRNSSGEDHRDFGPAIIYPDGGWIWGWRNLVHRVGGPAWWNGISHSYWLFGDQLPYRRYVIECERKTHPMWEEYDAYVRARGF